MNRTQYLLLLLIEECNEVAQRASKAMRFTLEEVQPGQEHTNAERICQELDDLHAVIASLHNEGILPRGASREAAIAKHLKIERFMDYSMSLGALAKDINAGVMFQQEMRGIPTHDKAAEPFTRKIGTEDAVALREQCGMPGCVADHSGKPPEVVAQPTPPDKVYVITRSQPGDNSDTFRRILMHHAESNIEQPIQQYLGRTES